MGTYSNSCDIHFIPFNGYFGSFEYFLDGHGDLGADTMARNEGYLAHPRAVLCHTSSPCWDLAITETLYNLYHETKVKWIIKYLLTLFFTLATPPEDLFVPDSNNFSKLSTTLLSRKGFKSAFM